ncbi:hypothetical protein EN12_22875 [Vibrio cholerae]|nr:hypothetical protein EN12_22875 [Vibrio cholerae]
MSKSIISQVNLKDVEFDGKPAIFSIRADSNIKAKLILNENGNLGIFLTVKGFSNELSSLVKHTQNLGWHSDFEIETFLPTDELTTLEVLKRKGLAFSILSDSIEDIFQNHIQTHVIPFEIKILKEKGALVRLNLMHCLNPLVNTGKLTSEQHEK